MSLDGKDSKKGEEYHNLVSLYESDDDLKSKRFVSEGKKIKKSKLSKITTHKLGRNNSKVSIDIIDSKRINTSQILEHKDREPKPYINYYYIN